jgi:hypothetical protein
MDGLGSGHDDEVLFRVGVVVLGLVPVVLTVLALLM